MAAVCALVLPASLFWALSSRAATVAPTFADKSFQQTWQRTDQLVLQGQVQRSWYWGPQPGINLSEPYAQGANGKRTVQYFDKARMEINNPSGDRNSEWFVTTGLLVSELVSGRQQVGNSQFVDQQPAELAIVGDGLATDPDAPTYTSFRLVSLVRAPRALGQAVTATINRAGQVGSSEALGFYPGAKLAAYSDVLGHNIPQAMWDFLNAKGIVLQNGAPVANQTIADWVYVMGYPISEPYWTRVKINGVYNDVLVQLYERRTLSYIPSFDKAWQVQMGNVGQHYYRWIYGGPLPSPIVQLPSPTPTLPVVPPSTDATVSTPINNVGSPIQISISGFQAGETIASWFTAPNNTTKSTGLDLTAGPDGKVAKITIQTGKLSVGQWAVTFHGVDSNHESLAYFYLLPSNATPVATASATRTAQATGTVTGTPTRTPQLTPGTPSASGTTTATSTRTVAPPTATHGTPSATPTRPIVPTQPPRGVLLSVRPGSGSASIQFTFIAQNLLPNEPIHIHFTTPSGTPVLPSGSSGQYTADAGGTFSISLVPAQAFQSAPTGYWLWEVDGDRSGQQAVVGFTIR